MATVKCTKAFTLSVEPLSQQPKAYWKMEEGNGANRIDAVGGVIASPGGSGSVNQVAGQVNFGANFVCSGVGGNANLSTASVASLAQLGTGIARVFWFKYNSIGAFTMGSAYTYGAVSFDTRAPSGILTAFISSPSPTITVTHPTALVLGTWYFIRSFYDPTTGKVGIQLNNGTEYTSTGTAALATSVNGAIGIATNSAFALPGNCVIDEHGFWTTKLSSSEVAYLYNGGAGRTYPFT